MTYICDRCQETKDEGIPATGHTYGDEWESDENGHWQICTECGEASDVSAHDFVWVADKIPTNTEEGLRHEECTVCGYKGASEVIPVLGSGTTDDGSGDAGQTDESAPVDEVEDTNSNTSTADETVEATADTNADSSTDDAPRTGDESNVVLSIIALTGALAAMAGIILYSKKRKA